MFFAFIFNGNKHNHVLTVSYQQNTQNYRGYQMHPITLSWFSFLLAGGGNL